MPTNPTSSIPREISFEQSQSVSAAAPIAANPENENGIRAEHDKKNIERKISNWHVRPAIECQSPTAQHHDGGVHAGQGRHDDRETLLHGEPEINQLHDGAICDRENDHRLPTGSPHRNGLGRTAPGPQRHHAGKQGQIDLHGFGKFAAEHPNIGLFDQIQHGTGDQPGRKTAKMDGPVDPRIAECKGNVQSDIDREEIESDVELAENPKAQQRPEDARRGTGRADRQIGRGMDAVADDCAQHHGAKIDEEEIGRSDPSLEMPAPQDQAQHVHGEVDEIDMQEAIGDEAPVFVPRDRGRVHAAVTIQQFRRR